MKTLKKTRNKKKGQTNLKKTAANMKKAVKKNYKAMQIASKGKKNKLIKTIIQKGRKIKNILKGKTVPTKNINDAPTIGKSIMDTRDYDRFTVKEKKDADGFFKHRSTYQSMSTNGFLPCFPLVVRKKYNKFEILDGFYRFNFAMLLKLPIYYTELEGTVDLSAIAALAAA